MMYSIAILAIMFLVGFDVGEALAVCALVAAALEIFRKREAGKND